MEMPKLIKGQNGHDVTYDEQPLSPKASLALRGHSPTGFSWGYGGSGPAQLALALLLHHTQDEEFSLRWYQQFKEDVIARLPSPDFVLLVTQIEAWVERKQREAA